MVCTAIYLVFLYLANWVQTIDVKVLERGDDWQCPSIEERERARKEIHQIAKSAVFATTGHVHTCKGTPGWKRIAFINMTDTSYDCPTGLNLISYSKRTCGRSHIQHGSRMFFNHIRNSILKVYHTAVYVGG